MLYKYIILSVRSHPLASDSWPSELWELGRLAALSGEHAGATCYLEEAHQIYTELGMVARVMETTALLAQFALGQG